MKNFIILMLIWMVSYSLIVDTTWDAGTKMIVFAMINSLAESFIKST